MKILLLGKNGQLGWELQRSLVPLGDLVAFDREDVDFVRPDTIVSVLNKIRPDIIVNAAAYTDVDKAESEPDLAKKINADSVEVLADWSAKSESWLIHYSTDYVFDGNKTDAYDEDDETNPLSIYGETKLEAEQVIQSAGCRYLIFRTSWIYATQGRNFVNSIVRLIQERQTLNVVNDQVGAPTGAELLADVTSLVMRQISASTDSKNYVGLYHLVAKGDVSWYGLARHILQRVKTKGFKVQLDMDMLKPISSDEYPLIASRPRSSKMSTAKLENTFNLILPHWQIGVERVVDELIDRKVL